MEEKNLDEKDPKDNMDSEQTQIIKESDSDKEKNSNDDEYLFDDTFKLISGNITLNNVEDYSKLLDQLESDYINNENIENIDNLIKDIAELKAYRDYLENFEKNNESIISLLVIVLTYLLAVIGLDDNKSIKFYDWITVIVLLLIIVFYYLFRISDNSSIHKARVINKIIYKLELREYYHNKIKSNYDNQHNNKLS